MQPIAANAGQHFAQLSHHPGLAAIEEGHALAKIGYGHRLSEEGTDLWRWCFAKRPYLISQHGAPARFVLLNVAHQLGNRTAAGRPCALESDPRPSALRL